MWRTFGFWPPSLEAKCLRLFSVLFSKYQTIWLLLKSLRSNHFPVHARRKQEDALVLIFASSRIAVLQINGRLLASI